MESKEFENEITAYGALHAIPRSRDAFHVSLLVKSLINNKEEIEAIKTEAAKDQLTGLWNKAKINEQIDNWMTEGRNFGILVADLANFKKINDDLGHLEGDNLLENTANLIQYTLRTNDEIGRMTARPHEASRWGGDEFVMLVDLSPRPGHDEVLDPNERLEIIADRLTERFFGHLEDSGLHEMGLGITIGYQAFDPARHKTGQDILADADAHMFSQKNDNHEFLGGAHRP